MNSASIGIELDHDGHKNGKMDAFPEAQMAALIKLLQEVTARHAIAPQNILGHSDIAPGRKIDPARRLTGPRCIKPVSVCGSIM